MNFASTKLAAEYMAGPYTGIDESQAVDKPAVDSPDAARELFAEECRWPDDREACWMLVLDTKHRLLATELVSLGAVSNTFMSPREILRTVLGHPQAAAIVLAHNHPSSDPEPSVDDEAVTRRIKRAAELVGIDLLDHLVLALPHSPAYVSLARRGTI